ncbi:hypothetical protein ETU09_02635 [Apibacter muscae]|uniref:Lipoprotein n=1 Tax=Apibacter muscae TaxID=2509004 RepID=A0A563DID3_9FLAO|nr:hypothetical protein [Apibacter muscae]TWP29897.1 hypothetical protein ETU09_02635 [Apibacter muscae]
MKKLLSLLFCIFLMVSCQSQTDLEALKFGTDIESLLKGLEDKYRDNSTYIPFPEYKMTELNCFKIGGITLNNYSLYNKVYLAVDSYKNNQFIGYVVIIQDPEKEQELTDYFLSQMGEPIKKYINEKKEKGYLDAQYLWDDSQKDRLVYIYRHHTQTKKGNEGEEMALVRTIFMTIKKGLVATPDKNNNPENVKKLLEENPRAFEVLEMIKAWFPN